MSNTGINRYTLIGGPEHGTVIQTQAKINERLYLNGSLYWPNGNRDEKGGEILVYAPIKPRSTNEVQD